VVFSRLEADDSVERVESTPAPPYRRHRSVFTAERFSIVYDDGRIARNLLRARRARAAMSRQWWARFVMQTTS
jgi:hypothetical protein